MELLTADELAKELKVSKAAIRAWTLQGAPCVPVGRLRRYERDPMLHWLAEREQKRAGNGAGQHDAHSK